MRPMSYEHLLNWTLSEYRKEGSIFGVSKLIKYTDGEALPIFGEKLVALHIHDNDLWHDSHQIPFSMRIDFEATVKALKEIHYDGEFTLEADQFLSAYTQENIFDGIKNMAECAKKLAAMFDSLTD